MRRPLTFVTALAVTAIVARPAMAAPGDLDVFFSHDGVQTAFANGAVAYAVSIDHHGRILVAGATQSVRPDVALARFTPSGELDPTFGEGGRVTTDLGASEYAFDLAIQPDGGSSSSESGPPS